MSDELTMVFWDVQHGSATYIGTPGGQNVVVDLGTGSYGESDLKFSPLLNLKDKWEVKQLDGVIITHPHRDHLDDIFNFDALSPTALRRPKHLTEHDIIAGNRKEDMAVLRKYMEINKRYDTPLDPGSNPFLPNNNGCVEFQSFTPSSCATSNINNHSVVTVISYAKSKVVIPGDNEPESWDELLQRSDFVSAIKGTDILVAPHHGRASGFFSDVFDYINPRLTIISDGRFCDTSSTNRYSEKTRGWSVHKRGGGKEDRKCVTTRKDGVILVKFGESRESKPYIYVKLD